ncbi:MAG: response regulator [Planctomycetota bacterium]
MKPQTPSGCPILLVDDEKLLRSNLAYALSNERSHSVVEASSGEEAVKALKENLFSLVISDIRMNKMNGLELLSHVTEKFPRTGVIIMTAFSSESQRFEVMGRGGLEYLEKPFSLEHFIHTVDRVLGKLMSGGFSTTLESVTLVDLIQLYCLNMESGCVQTRTAENVGEIYIVDGRFVHAVVGDIKGKDAITEMLAWEGGACTMERGIAPPEKSIPNLSADQVLLDCLRILDERQYASKDSAKIHAASADGMTDDVGISKSTAVAIEKAFSIFEREDKQGAAINKKEAAAAQDVVDRLCRKPGLDSVMVLDESGQSLALGAGCSGIDQEIVSKTLPSCIRLSILLGKTAPDMGEILLNDRKVCLFRLKFGYLCCWAQDHVKLGDILEFLKSNK